MIFATLTEPCKPTTAHHLDPLLGPVDYPIPLGDPDGPDETGPTAPPDFEPGPDDEAWWSGFSLRLAGEEAAEAPEHFDALRRADFHLGQVAALLELLRRDREQQLAEDREYDRLYAERMQDAFGDPTGSIHDCERNGNC